VYGAGVFYPSGFPHEFQALDAFPRHCPSSGPQCQNRTIGRFEPDAKVSKGEIGKRRRITPTLIQPEKKKPVPALLQTHPGETVQNRMIWGLCVEIPKDDDESGDRRWKTKLLNNAVKAGAKWGKNLEEEIRQIVNALYSENDDVKFPGKKDRDRNVFFCPICGKAGLKVAAMNMHFKRKHPKEYGKLTSCCRSQLIRYVLLETCFPGHLRPLAPSDLLTSYGECKCDNAHCKINFRRTVVRPQRKYDNIRLWAEKEVWTTKDIPDLPELPLLSNNMLAFLFGFVPDTVTETSLKSALEEKFAPSLEQNKPPVSARKRKSFES
jgi:hypothetical protein